MNELIVAFGTGLLVFFFGAAIQATEGDLDWAKRAGGTGWDYGRAAASYEDGSRVVTGYFQQTGIFGAGEVNETSLVSD